MPNYRFDLAQGSDDWLAARLGIPTASCFNKIVAPKTLELSKASKPYLCRLLAEWMYGAPLEAFISGWMDRGKDLEPEAIRYYEMERECETLAIGLVLTEDGMAGASPDRLVGDDGALELAGAYDGALELKCPALETHVGYMLEPQSLVDEYRLQVQGQLWVTGRAWADVMSYSPGFPAVIVRVLPDERAQKALTVHVPAFVEIMLRCRETLTQMYGELRRERVTAQQRVEASRAAFDEFIEGPRSRGVV